MIVLALATSLVGPLAPAHAASMTVDGFVARYNGQFVDVDGIYGAQCTDLFNRYHIDVMGGHYVTMGGNGGAKNLWTTTNAEMLNLYTKVGSNQTAQKGDVAVWGGTTYGHVAIVLGDSGSSLSVFHQNTCATNDAGVNNCPAQTGTHTKSNLLGYFRPKSLPTASNPFGALDAVSSPSPGVIRVGGWAADPDAKAGPIAVHVYANSQAVGITASQPRPDVATAYPGYGGNLGYSADLQFQVSGSVNVCTYAINVGAGDTNTQLGCKTITVTNPLPFGSLDAVGDAGGQRVSLGGWAADANLPAGPLAVHVYANGTYAGALTANAYRPDVPKVIGSQYGEHLGYSGTVAIASSGQVRVCAYGINTGPGWGNTELGCKDVTVARSVFGPTPTVSGQARVGAALNVSRGTWYPAPVSLAYVWLRNGTAIAGASGSSYTLTAADLAAAISVRITGSKTGYTSATRTSAATAKVTAGTLTGATPKISGMAKVGKTLTAKPGTWKPAGVTFTYQWLRNGKTITGATSAKYKLTKASKGKRITVTVTGHKTGYTTITNTSAKTSKVKK